MRNQHSGCVVFDTPAIINSALTNARRAQCEFVEPLLWGAAFGEFILMALSPGGRVPLRLMKPGRPPTVIIVGGDPPDGSPAPPPHAFAQKATLVSWARSVIVHATGGERDHYEAVVAEAKWHRKVLLIETTSAQEAAWMGLATAEVRRRAAEGRTPPRVFLRSATLLGGVHPVARTAA